MTMTPYRFTLSRMFDRLPLRRRILGVTMVNPSVAHSDDASKSDPTIDTLIRFARRDDYDGIIVTNVVPFRTAYPRELLDALKNGVDVFRFAENLEAIEKMTSVAITVVAAWGATVSRHPALLKHARDIRDILSNSGNVYCFGRTKGGHPRHPLYMRNDTTLQVYAARMRP